MGSQGNPIKVMVTGASGMLGRSLCRCLAQYPDDFVVVPLGFSRAVPPMRKVDLTDTAALRTLFSEVQPDVLVHTAAERDPDRAAKDPTRLDHLIVRAPLLKSVPSVEHILRTSQRTTSSMVGSRRARIRRTPPTPRPRR
jgi:nucleoside-diphosphate-sugar epimerase